MVQGVRERDAGIVGLRWGGRNVYCSDLSFNTGLNANSKILQIQGFSLR